MRAKDLDRLLRLVSNVTDAAWRRETPQSGAPGDAGDTGGTGQRPRPHSRLHDDYSRRVSACSSGSEHGAVRPPLASSPAPCPEDQDGLRQACPDSSAASQLPCDPGQPPTPLRPTSPKPRSPQSPGPGSAGCPASLSALSLSSADSEDRTEDSAPSQNSAQTPEGDEGRGDGDGGSHSQLSPGVASPEEKAEVGYRRGPSCRRLLVQYIALSWVLRAADRGSMLIVAGTSREGVVRCSLPYAGVISISLETNG